MTEETIKQIASIAWKGAANAHRNYPDNQHTFVKYWEGAEPQFDELKKQLLEQHEAEMGDRLFKVGLELRDKRHEVIQTLRSSVVNWNDIVEIFDRHGIDLVDKVEF